MNKLPFEDTAAVIGEVILASFVGAEGYMNLAESVYESASRKIMNLESKERLAALRVLAFIGSLGGSDDKESDFYSDFLKKYSNN